MGNPVETGDLEAPPVSQPRHFELKFFNFELPLLAAQWHGGEVFLHQLVDEAIVISRPLEGIGRLGGA